MKKYLLYHVGPFDKAETVLQRTHHPLILDRMFGIFQSDVTRSQVAPVSIKNCMGKTFDRLSPIIGGNLKADSVARSKHHVSLYVVFSVGQEKTLATVLITDPTHRIAP